MTQRTTERTGSADQGRYALVNGLKLYYQIQGTGRPLISLHGGFGMVGLYDLPLPLLAQTRQAVGVDLQGHGRTADIDRPLRFEFMADDIAALIEQLGFDRVDLMGYSLGGGVALQTAIRHPARVRKLVIVSTAYKSDGWYPESRVGMRSITPEIMAQTPLYEAYRQVAPHPEDWPTLVGKMKHLLGDEEYDWTDGVAKLNMPTLIMVGDADGVRLAHVVEMYGMLGGGKGDAMMTGMPKSQLAVLPGTIHTEALSRPDLVVPLVTSFLDAPMPEAM